MAGRPLRRLRNALRLNPLVGWADLSGMSPRQAWEPQSVLVKPGAKAKYEEVYTRVGLPLAVALHPEESYLPDAYALDEQMAERLNAVVLSVMVQERKGQPFYTRPDQRRGSPERVSPYSPFVLLHRLGDRMHTKAIGDASWMQTEIRDAAHQWSWVRDVKSYTEDVVLFSRGVDTAAGRMGVLTDDYLSDVWAKWLLTGRVAYSATEPPPESAEEANFRNMVAKYAPQIFRIWYDYLMRSVPSVFHI